MRSIFFCFALSCLLLASNGVCKAQKAAGQAHEKPDDSEGGILYGDNFAYIISAPKGWIMDDEKAREIGVSVTFYRRGETWKNGKAVMYVNIAGRDNGETARKVADFDIATFKKHNPKIKITLDKPLLTADKRAAIVYVFSGMSKGASDERVAYVETPTVVLLITLSAKTPADYQKALGDYAALVNSVAYLDHDSAERKRSKKAKK